MLSRSLGACVAGAARQHGYLWRSFSHSAPSSFIPLVTEVTREGWQTQDIFSRLLKACIAIKDHEALITNGLQERIVCLYGTVTDDVAASVTAQLLFLEAENPEKPIDIYINSPGGSVTAGLAILDTMEYITPPISTTVMGQAASMGSLLLAAGTVGRRSALPHASIMLHQPSGGHSGQASDIAIYAKEILRVREQLNKIYFRQLKAAGKERNMEEIEKLLERDYFMDAEHALELGIIDRVVTSRKVSKSDSQTSP